MRPGSPIVLGWYGIWADSTLVACAADRSTRAPGVAPVGFIGGVAVHPEHRRGGLGAAVTGELTRRLQRTHDLVALGVAADNLDAIRVYQRLGYAGRHRVTSVRHPLRTLRTLKTLRTVEASAWRPRRPRPAGRR